MKPKKSVIFLTLFICLISSLFSFIYSFSINQELSYIKKYAILSSIAIDSEKVANINNNLLLGNSKTAIINLKEYTDVVNILRQVKEKMPVDVLKTYLLYPGSSEEVQKISGSKEDLFSNGRTWTIISVLTTEPNKDDLNSLPGVVFETTYFPAMRAIIEGSESLVISEIVEDKMYKTWNREVFVKIFNNSRDYIAVLGIELTIQHELNIILTAFVWAILYSVVISLFLTLIWVRYLENKQVVLSTSEKPTNSDTPIDTN